MTEYVWYKMVEKLTYRDAYILFFSVVTFTMWLVISGLVFFCLWMSTQTTDFRLQVFCFMLGLVAFLLGSVGSFFVNKSFIDELDKEKQDASRDGSGVAPEVAADPVGRSPADLGGNPRGC